MPMAVPRLPLHWPAYGVVAAASLGMVATAMLISDERRLDRAAKLYAVQSLLLAIVFATLGLTVDVYMLAWAASALVTKTILVPYLLLRLVRTSKSLEERSLAGAGVTWASTAAATALGFTLGYMLGGRLLGVELGVAVTLFLVGLIQIIVRSSMVKQLLGLCHFENSSHLTLALLAPGLPETIEIGLATDAILLVFFGTLVALRVYRLTGSLDSTLLRRLRG